MIYSHIIISLNSFFKKILTYSTDFYLRCAYVIVAVPPPGNAKIIIRPPNERVFSNQMSYEPGKGTFFLAAYDRAWWLENNYSGDILGSSYNSDEGGVRLVYEATLPAMFPPAYLAGFIHKGKKVGWKYDALYVTIVSFISVEGTRALHIIPGRERRTPRQLPRRRDT